MPAIKKSDVLEDSVKKAFDDLNLSVRASVDLLVLMTKAAKDINNNLGAGNITQVTNATAQYSQQLKDQIKIETDLIRLERQRLALAEAQRKAQQSAANATTQNTNAQQTAAANLAAANSRAAAAASAAQAAQTRADEAARRAAAAQATAAQRNAAQLANSTSLYAQNSRALTDARTQARELGLQYGLNSRQFRDAQRNVQRLEDQMRRLDASLGQHQRNVGNYSGALRNFGAGLLGAFGITAGISGIIAGFKSVIQTSVQFNKALSSLRAITGVTGKEMLFFRDAAISMSKTTQKSATEIVKAFELVGSKSPELLKNKEALTAVTEETIRLSESSGGSLGLEESVGAVTAAMNTFGISALEAGRIANVFAAGSKEGSAEVSSLSEAFKNAGTVAKGANMTLEQTVAMLEVLGEKSIYGAEAGTKLRGSILKLQQSSLGYASGQFNLRDALEEANSAMDKLGSQMEKDAYKAKIFGAENITVGSIMMQNVDKYDALTKAVTGTSTAVEQQKIQNDNLSASTTRLGTAWDSWMLSLSGSNGLLKKGTDLLNDYIKTFNYITLDKAGKAGQLAAESIADLNTELSSLTINEQIGVIEEKLKSFNKTLKEGAEAAADEGIATQAWDVYISGWKAMVGERNVTEKEAFEANRIAVKQMQDRLNALYAEQAKQEDGIDLTKSATNATEEETKAKKESERVSRDLIAVKERELAAARAVEATDEASLITKQLRIKSIEEEIKRLQELSQVKQVDKIDTAGLDANLDKQFEELSDLYDKDFEDYVNNEYAKIEATRQAEEEKAAIRRQYAATVVDGISGIEDVLWENRAMARDEDLQKEIDANAARLDNEKLDDEQRREIEKDNAKREKALKIKKAKADKQDALFQIGTSTAMAVMKAWAEMGPWLAPATIPIILIQGALQAAAVSMRKIPEYATGVESHKGGLAVVGDGGRSELVEMPDGSRYITPNTDTLVDLPKGTRVTPGEEVANRLTDIARREMVDMARPATHQSISNDLIKQLISETIENRKAIKANKMQPLPDLTRMVQEEIFKAKLKN